MALTKEQTKHFVSRLNSIANKKLCESHPTVEPDDVKQARLLVTQYSNEEYKKKVARQAKIRAEENRLLDQLHFGEATELLAALKAFEETEFTN